MAFIHRRWSLRFKALSNMEDKDYELYEITGEIATSDEKSRKFLSDITIPGESSGIWYSDIRSYIEQMNLLDYNFDFWNISRRSCIDRKFEKAIKVKGGEVVVLKSEQVLGKRAWDHEEEFRSTEESLFEQSGSEPFNGNRVEVDDNREDAIVANTLIIDDPLPNRDRLVPPEDGGPQRLRSILMFDDIKEHWIRAVNSIKRKMEQAGLEEHRWWLESWDEDDKVSAKLWCHECKKWIGTGKPEQHSNTLSNFF
jgi:hypothetical protein